MLRYSLNLETPANAIESAVEKALRDGLRTADLGGDVRCSEAAENISRRLSAS